VTEEPNLTPTPEESPAPVEGAGATAPGSAGEPTPVADPTPAPEPVAAPEAAGLTLGEAAPGEEAAAPQAEGEPTARRRKRPNDPYLWGTGRRKAAVARVRIRPGDGKFEVNKRPVDDFFRRDVDRTTVRQPLEVTEASGKFDVFVNVRGGGTTGQAGAVVLGLARALEQADSSFIQPLRQHHLLSRDARKVERKKYGQRGARRRFQFSKR
jgi:small subunit ribosomal protein S9